MGNDKALRPVGFADFLGQVEAVRNLRIFVAAARARGDALDHILFAGGPGLGKTSLANVVATEMGTRMVVANATTIRSKADLLDLLASLQDRDVLFLDEIHALRPEIEELLYTAMEDFRVDVVVNSEATSIQMDQFTLIGATTSAGDVSQPMRDRFGEIVQMRPYTQDELSAIVCRSAEKLGLETSVEADAEIARRSRGTPRVANRLLRRVRDFAQAEGVAEVFVDFVSRCCDSLGIDELGLDQISRDYLRVLSDRGRPTGLALAASLLGESPDTIESAVEPFLVRSGLIERGPGGREATARGRAAAA